MKVPVLVVKVHGRSSKREKFQAFFRAGVKWTDDPQGQTVEISVLEATTESGLQADEKRAVLDSKKVIREADFELLLKEQMVMIQVLGYRKDELEILPKNANSPLMAPLADRLSGMVKAPAKKP